MKAELRQKGIYPDKPKSEPYFRFVDHIKPTIESKLNSK